MVKSGCVEKENESFSTRWLCQMFNHNVDIPWSQLTNKGYDVCNPILSSDIKGTCFILQPHPQHFQTYGDYSTRSWVIFRRLLFVKCHAQCLWCLGEISKKPSLKLENVLTTIYKTISNISNFSPCMIFWLEKWPNLAIMNSFSNNFVTLTGTF